MKKITTKLSLDKEVVVSLNELKRVTGGSIKPTDYGHHTADTCNSCGTPPPNSCDTKNDCKDTVSMCEPTIKDTYNMCGTRPGTPC